MISHFDSQEKWYNSNFIFEIGGLKSLCCLVKFYFLVLSFYCDFFLLLSDIVQTKHLDSTPNVTCVESKPKPIVILHWITHKDGRHVTISNTQRSDSMRQPSYCCSLRMKSCVYYVCPSVCVCQQVQSRYSKLSSSFLYSICLSSFTLKEEIFTDRMKRVQ